MSMKITLLSEGDKIHLKDKEGIYTVVATCYDGLYISCLKWQAINNYPEFIVKKWIKYSDIKCLAGGGHNYGRDIQTVTRRFVGTKGQLEQ